MKQLTTVQVWVHDQDEALAFYTEKLGLEGRSEHPVRVGGELDAVLLELTLELAVDAADRERRILHDGHRKGSGRPAAAANRRRDSMPVGPRAGPIVIAR